MMFKSKHEITIVIADGTLRGRVSKTKSELMLPSRSYFTTNGSSVSTAGYKFLARRMDRCSHPSVSTGFLRY